MVHRSFLKLTLAAWLLLLTVLACASDQAPAKVRVGVLEFGSVSWEIDVMRHHGLAARRGIALEEIRVASGDAATVALQGGAVDVIVTDWIWVTRQRAQSRPYVFVPFSDAVGALMVKGDRPYRSLEDLRGKRLGVAGGANDKTWLLLRAYAKRRLGTDMAQLVKPSFAAPPLLNELALRDEVDGALNYWHYAARLQAAGMRPLIAMPEILRGLGIGDRIPMIGWVFREDWAAANKAAITAFLDASYEAKALLSKSDEEWLRLQPIMRAENREIFIALRNGFREGIPGCTGSDTMQAVTDTFRILAEVGGRQLVGNATQLAPGTFWTGYRPPAC